jgi:hypothetical protein
MGKRTANASCALSRFRACAAKLAGSLELTLVSWDNAPAHFATVGTRDTNFSASLLVLRVDRKKVCHRIEGSLNLICDSPAGAPGRLSQQRMLLPRKRLLAFPEDYGSSNS